MKKPGERDRFPGGKEQRRFRLFEASRGLFGRRTFERDDKSDESPASERPDSACDEADDEPDGR